MWCKSTYFLPLLSIVVSTPVLAQERFHPLQLALGFAKEAGTINGSTGGSYSLTKIANFDRDKNACLGFANVAPNLAIDLKENFSQLTLAVNSRGKDTTLLIQTPSGQILCGDDTGTSKDASIQLQNLTAGEYKIWVGSMESGQRWNYTLAIRE